jgi:hypothetical protein
MIVFNSFRINEARFVARGHKLEFFTPLPVCSHINIIKDITIIVYMNHIRTAFFHRFPRGCFDFDMFF